MHRDEGALQRAFAVRLCELQTTGHNGATGAQGMVPVTASHHFKSQPHMSIKIASLKSRVILAMAVTLICIVALIVVAGRYYRELLSAQEWSTHTYRVIAALSDLNAATNSDRGLPYCAATGDPVFRRAQGPNFDYEERYRALVNMVRDDDAQFAAPVTRRRALVALGGRISDADAGLLQSAAGCAARQQ